VKTVLEIHSLNLSAALCAFMEKAARYTLQPLGSFVKMVLPLNLPPDVLHLGHQDVSLPKCSLADISVPQNQALHKMKEQLKEASGFCPLLFEGQTGSGKTEVYFHLMNYVLEQGKQCLILVPEIALTPQWIQRFKTRFGFEPTLWHSDLTPKKRREALSQIVQGRARVILGARSALFLPIPKLGLICVDEEHEGAYKQEENTYYHGRDLAVLRASFENIPALLASATPSLESLWNVAQGRYHHVALTERFGGELPSLEIIPHKPVQNTWISNPLRKALRETLQQKKQSLIFLNRRGYAPFVHCKGCGGSLTCPACDLGLVFHKALGDLKCHFCGYHQSSTWCRLCGAEDRLSFRGIGVEQLVEEIQGFLPEARLAVMSSDVASSVKKVTALVEKLTKHEVDVLVGTQMVAKGHHFPAISCVGIVDADGGLHDIDFRGKERLFQLLHQVGGRAGRGDTQGCVYLQTAEADHPFYEDVRESSYYAWAQKELRVRREQGLPPHERLVAIVLSGHRADLVQRAAARVAASIPRPSGLTVLGPTAAPLRFLKGKHRFRILLKAQRDLGIEGLLNLWRKEGFTLPSGVSLRLDRDPYHFL
jgi:primosomal protein N' (replication factor Y)